LVDIGLPDIDGYGVARRPRTRLGHHVQLVALTGYGQETDRRRAAEAGFALGSRALRADAYETITCAWLSLTTLAALRFNAVLGLWSADPTAALIIIALVLREGIEAWRGDDEPS